MKIMMSRETFRKKAVPYLLLSPGLIYFAFTSVWPIFYIFYLSFHKLNLLKIRKGLQFVGFDRFLAVLNDSLFYTSLGNTLYFTFGNVVVGGILALTFAVMIYSLPGRLRNTVRSISFLPVVTSLVAASIIWKWMFDPRVGVINTLLDAIGLQTLAWLRDSKLAMPSVLISVVWKNIGYRMLIFFAGLQGIPESYYEAAKIDGAGSFRQFLYITLPLLRPTIVFVGITSFIFSFQIFAPVYIMTGGGPGSATKTIVQYVYETAFEEFQMGKGAAISVFIFIIVCCVTVLSTRFRKEEQ